MPPGRSLLAVFAVLICISAVVEADIASLSEQEAITALVYALPRMAESPYNWVATSPQLACTWPQIGCDGAKTTIVKISFPKDQNLVGQLPAAMVNLTNLIELEILESNIFGPLPFHFDDTEALEKITISSCPKINGTVAGNSTKIRTVTLANSNAINGGIVPDLSGFTGLTDVALTAWTKKQPMPAWLSGHPTLKTISVSKVAFTGSLPSPGSNCNLQSYSFADLEHVVSSIPASLSNCTNLATLSVTDSPGVSGQWPTALNGLTGLIILNLAGCKLTGDLPAIGPSLQSYSLADNDFDGEMPASLGSTLQSFNVRYNRIHRPIVFAELPDSLFNFDVRGQRSTDGIWGKVPDGGSQVSQLLLDGNKFDTLPDFTTYPVLSVLTASNNNFSSIPASFYSLTLLNTLDFSKNPALLAGEPEFLTGLLQNSAQLFSVNLKDTGFGGTIPSDWSNATNLNHLSITTNVAGSPEFLNTIGVLSCFDGGYSNWGSNFLPVVSSSTTLQAVYCESCDLGTVELPAGKWPGGLQTLWLPNTGLTGNLTQFFVSNGDTLSSVDLSFNSFSELSSIGALLLSTLKLNNNSFSGPVPDISQLTSLSSIKLEGNDWTRSCSFSPNALSSTCTSGYGYCCDMWKCEDGCLSAEPSVCDFGDISECDHFSTVCNATGFDTSCICRDGYTKKSSTECTPPQGCENPPTPFEAFICVSGKWILAPNVSSLTVDVLDVPANTVIEIRDIAITLTSGVTATSTSTLVFSNAAITIDASTSIDGKATLSLASLTLSDSSTLTVTGGSLVLSNVSALHIGDSIIIVSDSLYFNDNAEIRLTSTTINVAGGDVSFFQSIDASFTQSSLTIDNGNVVFGQATSAVFTESVIQIQGGSLLAQDSSSLSFGATTVNIPNGHATFTDIGAIDIAFATINVGGGNVEFSGYSTVDFSESSLTVSAGNFAAVDTSFAILLGGAFEVHGNANFTNTSHPLIRDFNITVTGDFDFGGTKGSVSNPQPTNIENSLITIGGPKGGRFHHHPDRTTIRDLDLLTVNGGDITVIDNAFLEFTSLKVQIDGGGNFYFHDAASLIASTILVEGGSIETFDTADLRIDGATQFRGGSINVHDSSIRVDILPNGQLKRSFSELTRFLAPTFTLGQGTTVIIQMNSTNDTPLISGQNLTAGGSVQFDVTGLGAVQGNYHLAVANFTSLSGGFSAITAVTATPCTSVTVTPAVSSTDFGANLAVATDNACLNPTAPTAPTVAAGAPQTVALWVVGLLISCLLGLLL